MTVAGLLLVSCAATLAQGSRPGLPEGTWSGTRSVGDRPPREVSYVIRADDGDLEITVFGVREKPLQDIELDADVLSFSYPVADGSLTYRCRLNKQADGSYAGRCVLGGEEDIRLTMIPPRTGSDREEAGSDTEPADDASSEPPSGEPPTAEPGDKPATPPGQKKDKKD